jgi:hypothetical protein
LIGTPGLISLLDEFDLPCTWLVECHAENPGRDLPRLFPDLVKTLHQRPQDEIGTHTHWARSQNGRDVYPLEDASWIASQVGHATRTLEEVTGNAPVSFRGGGFLRVPFLPGILERCGYMTDATHIEPKVLRRLLAVPAQPYRCDPASASGSGSSGIIEFPTHFRVTSPATFRFIDRLLACHVRSLLNRFHTSFLNLYLHIDELTLPGSGRHEHAQLDPRAITRLRGVFRRLRAVEGVSFVTLSAARRIYLSGL